MEDGKIAKIMLYDTEVLFFGCLLLLGRLLFFGGGMERTKVDSGGQCLPITKTRRVEFCLSCLFYYILRAVLLLVMFCSVGLAVFVVMLRWYIRQQLL